MTRLPYVINCAFASSRASPRQSPVGAGSQKLVLMVVWAFEGEPLAHRQVAELSGLSFCQSTRAMRILVRRGMIVPKKSGRRSNSYRLNIEALRGSQLGRVAGPRDIEFGPEAVRKEAP